ncbi:hypothetical protein C8Q80DRAFT_378766 [Daedaleopsis nitida]|nr:hypothetical protein C8Q80DRAFT_378766 [Daedaleopsis nitida]
METYVPTLAADSHASSHHRMPPAIVDPVPDTERPTSIDAVVTELQMPIHTPSITSAQDCSASTPIFVHSPDNQPLPSTASPLVQGYTSYPVEELSNARRVDEEAHAAGSPLQADSPCLRSGSSMANPLAVPSSRPAVGHVAPIAREKLSSRLPRGQRSPRSVTISSCSIETGVSSKSFRLRTLALSGSSEVREAAHNSNNATVA